MCIAFIITYHRFIIQPEIPGIRLFSCLVIRIFLACAMIFCTDDRVFFRIIIALADTLAVCVILVFYKGKTSVLA